MNTNTRLPMLYRLQPWLIRPSIKSVLVVGTLIEDQRSIVGGVTASVVVRFLLSHYQWGDNHLEPLKDAIITSRYGDLQHGLL
ncbi:hypothetical protein ACOBV9_20165 (plasmid) [Pseudoalteromonas espejiana]